MRNETNLVKYKYLALIYDGIVNPFFAKARKRVFALLDFKANDDILFVGIGTGLDLPYIPKDCFITGIDLSEEMLNKARYRVKNRRVELYNMNAEDLEFENQTFDYVVLSLILSVVENPKKVISEAVRVLNDNGKILVFDKFVKGEKAGVVRKIFN
jgi:phosphatidylethanolamine/phosphatidyl-N-methylethanolamine N-methyltransferase